jgi:hypothetical protein
MATVTVTTDKTSYELGEQIVASVVVDGADPGSSKPVSFYAVAEVDGVVIQSVPVTFDVTDPPDVVTVTAVTSSDPAIVFAKDAADQFVWTATAA